MITSRTWKDLSLNDSLTEDERASIAVWNYPVTDRYTKIWAQMQEAMLPKDYEFAVKRVQQKTEKDAKPFALISNNYLILFINQFKK